MLYQLQVPAAMADVTEVRVLQWHVAAGEPVAPGSLLVEVETHKAVVEIRAERPGVLRAILCDEGAWQAVGAPMAMLSDTADEAVPADAATLAALAVSFEAT
jgi:pyruvate/2-oxoglutarate dehydrogenase complex dihydrolipoamide acyltransferase (E2) component